MTDRAITIEHLTPARLAETLEVLIPLYEAHYEPFIRTEIAKGAVPNDHQQTTFIALVDGKVAGAVQILLNYVNTETYDLIWLSVGKNYQGLGLSKKLMDHAENYVAQMLLKGEPGTLMLADFTRHQNPDSKFYLNLGYTEGPLMHDARRLCLRF
ncbi:MAG: GNAT family N-acetyltransferase [Alphaproteobacteria bacterium]|nr:GNAT family N-acetyltransferase [Alphaproteobacteria bacterium]MCD8525853.1 GNAT family N-acetyltransferase [Alphaproteobacteria bacterium]MCD8570856.1 GNAT family N-acetyltransferase [Alphaproteobacteria bacterium]